MTTDQTIAVETYVLYRSPNGEKYHRKAGCATDPDVPPMLDAAASLFNELEMVRVGEAEINRADLCENCAGTVRRELEGDE